MQLLAKMVCMTIFDMHILVRFAVFEVLTCLFPVNISVALLFISVMFGLLNSKCFTAKIITSLYFVFFFNK